MTTRLLSPVLRSLVFPRHVAGAGKQQWGQHPGRHHLSTSQLSAGSVSALLTASNLSSSTIVRQVLWPFRLKPFIWTRLMTETQAAPSATPAHFFTSTSLYSRSAFLHDFLSRFSTTRAGLALRNTYYSRLRTPAQSRLGGSGSSGGGGGRNGFGFVQRVTALINALPSSVIVWTIIALNGIVFMAWQYAESSFVRLVHNH